MAMGNTDVIAKKSKVYEQFHNAHQVRKSDWKSKTYPNYDAEYEHLKNELAQEKKPRKWTEADQRLEDALWNS